MPKYKTERIILDGSVKRELDFKIDVNVDEAGFFTTTLPKEIADLFRERGISLATNGRRNARPGFYREDTYFKLVEAVKFSCKEYVSRELIRESTVIQYVIETSCAYLIDDKGEIVPNGRWVKNYGVGDETWREGTLSQHATDPHPFGVRIYAKPFHKKEYRYKSGAEKCEYDEVSENECEEEQPNLKWLAGVCSISKPKGKLHEIEYTEKTAFFFVNFYKTLCGLNEKLKRFVTPENLLALIEQQFPLLDFNKQA